MDLEQFSTNYGTDNSAAVSYYKKVLMKLSEAALTISSYSSEKDIKVTIAGTQCVLSKRQLGEHIKIQSMFFERLLEQATDRLSREQQEV